MQRKKYGKESKFSDKTGCLEGAGRWYQAFVGTKQVYDRTSVSKNPWYLGLGVIHIDPIVNKYKN